MSLDQLADLGEFIGGIAVVVSLVYLAVQIRQNTQALRRNNTRHTSQRNSDALREWANNTDLMIGGFAKLPTLTPAERLRFNMVWIIWFQGIEQMLEDEEENLHDPGFSQPYRLFLRGMLSTEAGRAWWEQMRLYFSPQFQTHMRRMGEEGSEELGLAFENFLREGMPGDVSELRRFGTLV